MDLIKKECEKPKHEPLKVGEQYLYVRLKINNQTIEFNAYPNESKVKPNQPDFKFNDLAIWVKEKKGCVQPKKVIV